MILTWAAWAKHCLQGSGLWVPAPSAAGGHRHLPAAPGRPGLQQMSVSFRRAFPPVPGTAQTRVSVCLDRSASDVP